MNYAELLKSYIKNSRYTLEEISDALLKSKHSASVQYLSRLQNGKNPPASEELNKALADITGGDPKRLVWAAYIEKAPEDMKGFWALFDDEVIDTALRLNTSYPDFLSRPIDELRGTEEFESYERAFRKFVRNHLKIFKELPIGNREERQEMLDNLFKNELLKEEYEKYNIDEDLERLNTEELNTEEHVFFKEFEQLSDDDKQKALEHIRFLRHLAEKENINKSE